AQREMSLFDEELAEGPLLFGAGAQGGVEDVAGDEVHLQGEEGEQHVAIGRLARSGHEWAPGTPRRSCGRHLRARARATPATGAVNLHGGFSEHFLTGHSPGLDNRTSRRINSSRTERPRCARARSAGC